MTVSIDSRMIVYRSLVKTMNSCGCPVVREMLLEELFRQYRMLISQMEPKLQEFQAARLKLNCDHFDNIKDHFCSASDIGG